MSYPFQYQEHQPQTSSDRKKYTPEQHAIFFEDMRGLVDEGKFSGVHFLHHRHEYADCIIKTLASLEVPVREILLPRLPVQDKQVGTSIVRLAQNIKEKQPLVLQETNTPDIFMTKNYIPRASSIVFLIENAIAMRFVFGEQEFETYLRSHLAVLFKERLTFSDVCLHLASVFSDCDNFARQYYGLLEPLKGRALDSSEAEKMRVYVECIKTVRGLFEDKV